MSVCVVARRLVTTYAPDPAPCRPPLRGRAVAGLQRLYACVRPDRSRPAAGVGGRRFELQQQGYVAAFHDPRVLRAIQLDATQVIAVTMVQWTGPALQIQVLPSTLIKDTTTAHAFAAAIAATPRRSLRPGASPASRRCEVKLANNQ
jgi:hypothetical protein